MRFPHERPDAALERHEPALDILPADIAAEAQAALVAARMERATLAHDTGRTHAAPEPQARHESGHESPWRTFGRGTEADAYEVLDGAPVGCPESLAGAKREADANRDDLHWAIRNVLADAGLLLTRKQRRNRKRAAARARHKEGV